MPSDLRRPGQQQDYHAEHDEERQRCPTTRTATQHSAATRWREGLVMTQRRPRTRPADGPDPRLVLSLDGEAESRDRRTAVNGVSRQPSATLR
jgi:hypothetical protein